jgi:hypothetical protein
MIQDSNVEAENSVTARQRIVIEACLRHKIPFFWQSTGTLLIAGTGVQKVLHDLSSRGHRILGLEGFELESPVIHPRLDLIFDASRRPDINDPSAIAADWPEEVWVDVSLADAR